MPVAAQNHSFAATIRLSFIQLLEGIQALLDLLGHPKDDFRGGGHPLYSHQEVMRDERTKRTSEAKRISLSSALFPPQIPGPGLKVEAFIRATRQALSSARLPLGCRDFCLTNALSRVAVRYHVSERSRSHLPSYTICRMSGKHLNAPGSVGKPSVVCPHPSSESRLFGEEPYLAVPREP